MNRYKRKVCFSLMLSAGLIVIAIFCAMISKIQSSKDSSRMFASNSAPEQSSSADHAFEEYINDLFCQEVSANGLTLHYTLEHPEDYGISRYNTSLGSFSVENNRISAALAENVSAVLDEFDPNALSIENQLTLELLKDTFYNASLGASFPWYEEPLRPTTGDQAELPVLLAEYTFSDKQDINDYLAILESIPSYFDSICIYENEKYDRNLFMPDFAAKTVIQQCRDFAASAENNYLLYTFDEKIDQVNGLSNNEKLSYKEQNRGILTDKVLPAYEGIAETLSALTDARSTADNTSSTEKSTQNQTGLCHFPRGREYYEYLVRFYTGSDDSVETLQERVAEKRTADLTAAAAVIADHPELEKEIIRLEAGSDLDENPILSGTPEEMLDHLKTEIQRDFPQAKDCSYTVKYVNEAMEPYMAPAFYLTSPLDHFTENSIYINKGCHDQGLSLFTTLAHEGYPGHLYQNVAFCGSDPAPIRALLGPAGYTEGWATYVEMLSYHYAGLSPELADLLSLEQAAILSLYATADMGIHYDGWSFTQTLDFFSEHGFTEESIIREIFQLIIEEPAHYLKYYIGYLEFLSLKDYAKQTLGRDYNDKAFHHTILNMGPAAFPLLKKYLLEYYSS